MAGDQAPELARHDDGNRHRGIDAHVAQVFTVDRRNVAQDRMAHVQRLVGARVQLRRQRRRVVVDLGDQPQPAPEVERPGLLWDVGGRIMQVQERRQFGGAAFGDHPAGPVLHEAIDHHPVVLRHATHARRRHLAERKERRRGAEPLDHQLHSRQRIRDEGIVGRGGLELQDQIAVDAVRAGVERGAPRDAQNRVEEVPRLDQVRLLAEGANAIDLLAGEQVVERSGQKRADGATEQAFGVARRLEHTKTGAVEHQHGSVRQDRPRDVDRFAVAIGEVDLITRRDGVSHRYRSIRQASIRTVQKSRSR